MFVCQDSKCFVCRCRIRAVDQPVTVRGVSPGLCANAETIAAASPLVRTEESAGYVSQLFARVRSKQKIYLGFCHPVEGGREPHREDKLEAHFIRQNSFEAERRRTFLFSVGVFILFSVVACQDMGDSFYCSCPPLYGGSRCETRIRPCDNSPCRHDEACQDDPRSALGFRCLSEYSAFCITNTVI